MFETELKFQVPAAQRAALLKAMATGTAVTTRLQAVYADTADRRLAAAGLALRLRKEGRVWVQTLKGRGDGFMQRLEHEVRLPAQRGVPTLDAKRHQASAVGQQLQALLADGAPLLPVYRTDIRRLHRQVRHAGALVELAYDRGHIIAGDQRVVVDELELELKRGPGDALVSLAQRWTQRFNLWWDVRTKSERGYRLAFDLAQVPATRAALQPMPADHSPGQALAQMVSDGLAQALPNAAEIASDTSTPEHLHQLRVALRRMRSLLRVFADWAADPADALALQADWREPFVQLGAARDIDVMAEWLLPALAAAGAPQLAPLPAPGGPSPGEVVRSANFNQLMLRSLALALAARQASLAAVTDGDAPASAAKLSDQAGEQVKRHWRRVRRDIQGFEQAELEAQHSLRKRIKRLRYALEAVQTLMKRRQGESLLKATRRALLALGRLNDLVVAEARYRQQAVQDPQAWFAVGYLVAQRQQVLRQAGKVLLRLRQESLAWR